MLLNLTVIICRSLKKTTTHANYIPNKDVLTLAMLGDWKYNLTYPTCLPTPSYHNISIFPNPHLTMDVNYSRLKNKNNMRAINTEKKITLWWASKCHWYSDSSDLPVNYFDKWVMSCIYSYDNMKLYTTKNKLEGMQVFKSFNLESCGIPGSNADCDRRM